MSDIKQGDTVRIGKGVTDYTVVVAEPDRRGVLIVATPEGEYLTARLDHNLVKVEPTPADVFMKQLRSGMSGWYHTPDDAKRAATGATGRIARFAFAGWVDTEEVES